MKKSIHKLTVGKENAGLDLYCSLKIDGEEKKRFRSRSFLGSFAWLMQSMMHGGRAPKLANTSERRLSIFSWGVITDSDYIITDDNAQTPMRISGMESQHLAHFVDYDDPDKKPNYVTIINAPDPTYNGTYLGKKDGSSSLFLYHMDGSPVEGSEGAVVGASCISMFGFPLTSRRYESTAGQAPNCATEIQNWQVIVGTSNKPVSVEDVYLDNKIMHGENSGQLSHGGVSVSSLTTDKPTSRFTISKPFTNGSGETIEVSEIGVICHPEQQSNTDAQQGNSAGYTIVRDTLDSPLSIPTGKTLTVDYELVVRLTPDTQNTDADGTNGGFLENFMDLIKGLAQDDSTGRSAYLSCATSPGLGSYSAGTSYQPDEFGIRLGDDNQFTSMTDQSLSLNDVDKNGFEHGEDDGQLYHYGTDVGLVKYDHGENKATFQITRIFENRGSVPIEVKEIGLFGNDRITTTLNDLRPAIIARTALDQSDQFTISPGEFRQVVYEVEVIA